MVMRKNLCDIDLCSQMSIQKTFLVKLGFSQKKIIWHFVTIEHLTIGFIFFGQSKFSLLSWRIIVHMGFMCIIWFFGNVRRGNAIEMCKRHAC